MKQLNSLKQGQDLKEKSKGKLIVELSARNNLHFAKIVRPENLCYAEDFLEGLIWINAMQHIETA